MDIKIDNNAIDKMHEDILTQLSEFIVEEAKVYAPVDTGTLRDSIEIVNKNKDSADIATTCGYGLYLELGTIHTSAQPFLRVALDHLQTKLRNM